MHALVAANNAHIGSGKKTLHHGLPPRGCPSGVFMEEEALVLDLQGVQGNHKLEMGCSFLDGCITADRVHLGMIDPHVPSTNRCRRGGRSDKPIGLLIHGHLVC